MDKKENLENLENIENMEFLPLNYILNLAGEEYVITRALGKGGSSNVYKAERKKDSEPHIIKELYPREITGIKRNEGDYSLYIPEKYQKTMKEYEIRAEKEQATLQTLRRIKTETEDGSDADINTWFKNYHQPVRSNGTLFTVIDSEAGDILYDMMKSEGKNKNFKDFADICEYILRILEALEPLHEKGYLHLDVSPDNIHVLNQAVGGKRIVNLIDFNSAYNTDSADSGENNKFSVKKGYSAHELQQKAVKNLSPATDIFSVMVIFFELLMNRLPKPSDPVAFSRGENVLAEGGYLENKSEYLTNSVNQALRKGLKTVALNRYQSCSELRAVIEDLKKLYTDKDYERGQEELYFFMGRQKELQEIKSKLDRHSIAVVSSDMGFGKTYLAELFSKFYYKKNHKMIVSDSINSIFNSLNFQYDYSESALTDALLELSANSNALLLIFDNLCDIEDFSDGGISMSALNLLEKFLRDFRKHSNIKIIITTRKDTVLELPDDCYVRLRGVGEKYAENLINSRLANKYDFTGIFKNYRTVVNNENTINSIIVNTIMSIMIFREQNEKSRIDISDIGKFDDVRRDILAGDAGLQTDERKNLISLLSKFFRELEIINSRDAKIYIDMIKFSSLVYGEISQKFLIELLKMLRKDYSAISAKDFEPMKNLAKYFDNFKILCREKATKHFFIHRGYQEAVRALFGDEDFIMYDHIIENLQNKLQTFSYYGYGEWKLMREYFRHLDEFCRNYKYREKTGGYANPYMGTLFLHHIWYAGYVVNEENIAEKYEKTKPYALDTSSFQKVLALIDKQRLMLGEIKKIYDESADKDFVRHYNKQFEEINKITSEDLTEAGEKIIIMTRQLLIKLEFCLFYGSVGCGTGLSLLSDYYKLKTEVEALMKNVAEKDSGKIGVFSKEHLGMISNMFGVLHRRMGHPLKSLSKHVEALQIFIGGCAKKNNAVACPDCSEAECVLKDSGFSNLKSIEKCDLSCGNDNLHNLYSPDPVSDCDYLSIAFTQNSIGVFYMENFSAACVLIHAACDYFIGTYQIYKKLSYQYGKYNQIQNICMTCRKIASYIRVNGKNLKERDLLKYKLGLLKKLSPLICDLKEFEGYEKYIPPSFYDEDEIPDVSDLFGDLIFFAKGLLQIEIDARSKINSYDTIHKLKRYIAELEIENAKKFDLDDKGLTGTEIKNFKKECYHSAEVNINEAITINETHKLDRDLSKLYRNRGIIKRNRQFELREDIDTSDIEQDFLRAAALCGESNVLLYRDYQLAQIELLALYSNQRDAEKSEALLIKICVELTAKNAGTNDSRDNYEFLAGYLLHKMKTVSDTYPLLMNIAELTALKAAYYIN